MDIDGKPFGGPLPFPLIHSISIPVHERARSRRITTEASEITVGSSGICTDSDPPKPPTIWKVDPSKLPTTKKSKYFGVRIGREVGIYFAWDETEKQVRGFQGAVHQAFRSVAGVEDYMNHPSEKCVYSSCGHLCKEAVKVSRDTLSSEASDATLLNNSPLKGKEGDAEPEGCACCGNVQARYATLCTECLADPSGWLEKVITENGLTEEQSSILRSVADGNNVFFTGAAGTGKSTVVQAIQKFLKGLDIGVETIAPTGTAALNVEGQTIHRYAGWNVNTERMPLSELCGRHAHYRKVWHRIACTDVLIIDEISMVESNLLTRLSQMMQAAMSSSYRGNEKKKAPFGGIQVIATGDLYQLPPTVPFKHCLHCGERMQKLEESTYICKRHGEIEDDEKWVFCSPIWEACNFDCIELQEVHRQRDPVFQSILEDLRIGRRWTDEQIDLLQFHQLRVTYDETSKIHPLRKAVNQINHHYMQRIDAREMVYSCVDGFHWHKTRHPDLKNYAQREEGEDFVLKALEGHRFEKELELKCGMKVILLSNLSRTLVNGSVGQIIGFLEMMPGIPRAARKKDSPDYTGRILFGTHASYEVQQIREFARNTPQSSRAWPEVKFENGETRVIFASCLVQELGRDKPYSLLSRTQIPLIAGWAITVHKSQGMTLNSVSVDLGSSFELGQAYVALSRARSLDGLIVQSIPKHQYTVANPVVESFLNGLFGERSESGGEVVKMEERW